MTLFFPNTKRRLHCQKSCKETNIRELTYFMYSYVIIINSYSLLQTTFSNYWAKLHNFVKRKNHRKAHPLCHSHWVVVMNAHKRPKQLWNVRVDLEEMFESTVSSIHTHSHKSQYSWVNTHTHTQSQNNYN